MSSFESVYLNTGGRVICLAFVYRRADCWYVSPALSKLDGAIKCVHVLHYFALVFCQDFVNDVDMLGADMTKLKCHAERLMSARHPAAAAIQVRWHRVTPEHLLTCSGSMRRLLFVTITYLCWWHISTLSQSNSRFLYWCGLAAGWFSNTGKGDCWRLMI